MTKSRSTRFKGASGDSQTNIGKLVTLEIVLIIGSALVYFALWNLFTFFGLGESIYIAFIVLAAGITAIILVIFYSKKK